MTIANPTILDSIRQCADLTASIGEEDVVDAADGDAVGGLAVAEVEGALGVLHLVAERVRLQVLRQRKNVAILIRVLVIH